MTNLTQASHQWASRPADERFTSLPSLLAHTESVRHNSRSVVVSSRALELRPTSADPVRGLEVVGPNGHPYAPTNWAFGQLCQRAGAPSGYLSGLPAPIAADCVNYGLKYGRDMAEVGCYLHRDPVTDVFTLKAATGPTYGRVHNATIAAALVDRFGDGVTGDFRIPSEFGDVAGFQANTDNTTLYASDRDMFVFLADEVHRIEVPNRRDGKSGDMARGFFVWNSEVGAQTFGVCTFLFDYACKNRIVWGATGIQEIRIRHTKTAPDKWIEQVAPAMVSYANSSTNSITDGIAAAKAARLENVGEWLAKRFSKSVANGALAAHMADEQRPIESLWDVATGLTAYARSIPYQDERVKLERQAGDVLDLVAVAA